jgi:hypothetical protein
MILQAMGQVASSLDYGEPLVHSENWLTNTPDDTAESGASGSDLVIKVDRAILLWKDTHKPDGGI